MQFKKTDLLGVVTLWVYRKTIISVVYLLIVGVAFGAIWHFYNNTVKTRASASMPLAFEEDHKIIEVVIAHQKISKKIPKETEKIIIEPSNIQASHKDIWRKNAVKVVGFVDNSPQISIVIDDLGLIRSKTLGIINLPAPLTLSFLPYGRDLHNLTHIAHDKGHELMLHLPMEPKGDMDPGPHAMLKKDSEKQMLKDLTFNLSRFNGYVGLNNHMGSAFTEYRKGLDIVLTEVQKRGILVLDSRTSRKSILAEMASEKNIPNMTRDYFLDNQQDVSYILAQLEKLEKLAYKNGHAIAIGHPYSETIEALSLWLPTLKEKGIVIVPLSHLVKRKYDKIIMAKKDRDVFSTP